MCLIRAQPMLCIRQQAARMLDNWEDILDAKKHEMMGECQLYQEIKIKCSQGIFSTIKIVVDKD